MLVELNAQECVKDLGNGQLADRKKDFSFPVFFFKTRWPGIIPHRFLVRAGLQDL